MYVIIWLDQAFHATSKFDGFYIRHSSHQNISRRISNHPALAQIEIVFFRGFQYHSNLRFTAIALVINIVRTIKDIVKCYAMFRKETVHMLMKMRKFLFCKKPSAYA